MWKPNGVFVRVFERPEKPTVVELQLGTAGVEGESDVGVALTTGGTGEGFPVNLRKGHRTLRPAKRLSNRQPLSKTQHQGG